MNINYSQHVSTCITIKLSFAWCKLTKEIVWFFTESIIIFLISSITQICCQHEFFKLPDHFHLTKTKLLVYIITPNRFAFMRYLKIKT